MRQGIVVALCLWFGFYVKLWVVYALPALGLYYLVGRRWRAAIAFTVASLVIHGLTCVVWWRMLGTPIPFISMHAANYPVPLRDLPDLFMKYVRLIFVGSFEFPTTLFGAVPWIAVALMAAKVVALAMRRPRFRPDRGDWLLFGFYTSFFFWLEFFPNGFQLDAYYSVPRIFRYLAPISFPLALHAAKLVLDAAALVRVGWPVAAARAATVLVLALNLAQSAEATRPSRIYRENLLAVLHDVRAEKPPVLVAESVLASYLRDLYLDPDEDPTEVVVLVKEHRAADYEQWLRTHEAELPDGTMLVTGLASFVHYGAHVDGFRLAWFGEPLGPEWKLVHQYGLLSYLPQPEPARLWRLERPTTTSAPAVTPREDLSRTAGIDDVPTLFFEGMRRYDALDYPGARIWFAKILRVDPRASDDAAFFYAASFFREADCRRARHQFKRLIRRYPDSRWVPAAYWHLGTCEAQTGHLGRARRIFTTIVRRFPNDPTTVRMAHDDLARLHRRGRGWVQDWWEGP